MYQYGKGYKGIYIFCCFSGCGSQGQQSKQRCSGLHCQHLQLLWQHTEVFSQRTIMAQRDIISGCSGFALRSNLLDMHETPHLWATSPEGILIISTDSFQFGEIVAILRPLLDDSAPHPICKIESRPKPFFLPLVSKVLFFQSLSTIQSRYPTLFWLWTLWFLFANSHSCSFTWSSKPLQSKFNQVSRITSSPKNRDENLRGPQRSLKTLKVNLEILSIKLMNRINQELCVCIGTKYPSTMSLISLTLFRPFPCRHNKMSMPLPNLVAPAAGSWTILDFESK